MTKPTQTVDTIAILNDAFASYDVAVQGRTDKESIVLEVQGNVFKFKRVVEVKRGILSTILSLFSRTPYFDSAMRMKDCFLRAKKSDLTQIKAVELKANQEKFNQYVEERFRPNMQDKLKIAIDFEAEARRQQYMTACKVATKMKDKKDSGNFVAALKEHAEHEMNVLKGKFEETKKEEFYLLENRRLQILGWLGEMANYAPQLSDLSKKASKVEALKNRLMQFQAVDFRGYEPAQLLDQRCLQADLLILEANIKKFLQEAVDKDIETMKKFLCRELEKNLKPLLHAVQKPLAEKAFQDTTKALRNLEATFDEIEQLLQGVALASKEDKQALKTKLTFKEFQAECEARKISARNGKDEKVEAPAQKTVAKAETESKADASATVAVTAAAAAA